MLLYDILAKGAANHADKKAVFFHDRAVRYGELYSQVNRLANTLPRFGISSGVSVSLRLPNCPEFTAAYYAITALGGICVPVNPGLKAPELAHIWSDSEVRCVFTVPELLERASTVLCDLGERYTLICVGGASTKQPGSIAQFEELLHLGTDTPVSGKGITEQDPAVCIYTSGTTGRPKGALLSHRNLVANCRQIIDGLALNTSDNILCVLPLFHAFAGTVCQNTALYCGAAITIVDQFQPVRLLDTIAKSEVTVVPAVPAIFSALLQLPADTPADLSRVRMCLSGGAPMPASVMEAFEKRFGTIILEGDGPTECGPATSVNPPHGIRKPGSVGIPLPGVQIKIFDDNDRELPAETIGEIVVRGDNVMLGYRNQLEQTAEAMKSGWYHTGDLGKMDRDGYLYILDRKKDMLIVGGLNVYPREIEEILLQHPAVAEAAVIGEPDQRRGEQVLAVVVKKAACLVNNQELIRFCRNFLANYKVPRRILFRDSLPRGGTGKVVKRLLRKELEMECEPLFPS